MTIASTFFLRCAALACAAALTTAATAQELVPVRAAEVNHADGVAVQGYDLVAYFTAMEAVKGVPEFVVQRSGVTYRFRNAANRDAFVAAPEKYLPQYGGFCAYGAASGYKANTDPSAFSVRDGKLYLNYNAKVKSTWEGDATRLIARADARWTETAKADKMYK